MSRAGTVRIKCRLTDKRGNILDPCQPGAISYVVTPARRQVQPPAGKVPGMDRFRVMIKGYIALFSESDRITDPAPFKAYKNFLLHAPRGSELSFKTVDFRCGIRSICATDSSFSIKINVSIGTMVYSKAMADLIIPAFQRDKNGNFKCQKECVQVEKIFHQCYFRNELAVTYREEIIRAEVYQYNSLSDGTSKIYTNDDELKQYGRRGILDPQKVSYYALLVNGVLRPRANYEIAKGFLRLKTEDAPPPGAPLAISFVTFKNKSGELLPAEVYCYNTVSDGVKREYTNADELKIYGNKGIADPEQASFVNLYINGVLQPPVNYAVKKGLLSLLTTDIPRKGVPITLEFITIRGTCGRVLKASTYIYNALAHDKRVYTSEDELRMYGNMGIPDPRKTSCHNLSINAVRQPAVNYSLQKGLLTLNTADLPLAGSPVSLQFITVTSSR